MNVLAFVHDHHAEIVEAGAAALALVNGGIKLALYLRPLPDWVALAEKQPRLAAGIRLLDALGISPLAVAQSLIDIIRGTASAGTVASTRAAVVSASKPLISPPKVSP